MTIAAFLAQATAALVAADDASARLDVLILLEDALGRDRASILAHSDDEIPTPVLHLLNTQIIQRSSRRPLAYIRGKAAFYGRVFEVTPAVLVPRPETETM